MASLEGFGDNLLFHIFSFLDTGDLKSVSLVCKQWCSVSNTCQLDLSLDPFHRGLPRIQDELPHLISRFHHVGKLKIFVVYGLGKKFIGGYYPSIGNVAVVVESLLKVHAEQLESLHTLWVKRLSFEFPAGGFPRLRRLQFSSSDNTACDDPHDHIFKVFAQAPNLESFEYRNVWPLNSASSAVETLVKNPTFQQLRSLNLRSRLAAEALYNILEHCPMLVHLKVDKVFSLYEEILLTDRTPVLVNLTSLTVTFTDSFFTDDSGLSLFSHAPGLRKLVLISVPPITVIEGIAIDHLMNSWVTDVGINTLASNCHLLETLKLDLPIVANSEVFLEGFHHLREFYLGKRVKIAAGRTAWMSNMAKASLNLRPECFVVEGSFARRN